MAYRPASACLTTHVATLFQSTASSCTLTESKAEGHWWTCSLWAGWRRSPLTWTQGSRLGGYIGYVRRITTSHIIFFNSGVAMTCICNSDNRPWASYALTMLSLSGTEAAAMNSRTMNVSTGSSERAFAGDFITNRRTSAGVRGRNDGTRNTAFCRT